MYINQAKINTSIKKHNQSIIKHNQSNLITIIKENLNSSRKQASKVINQRQVTCWYHLIPLVGLVDQVVFVRCIHRSHIYSSWDSLSWEMHIIDEEFHKQKLVPIRTAIRVSMLWLGVLFVCFENVLLFFLYQNHCVL